MRSAAWPIAVAVAAPPVAWLAVRGFGLRLLPLGIADALLAFVAAPLLEEWIFRSLLQRGVADRLAARGWPAGRSGVAAAGIATLVFPAAHLFRSDAMSWPW